MSQPGDGPVPPSPIDLSTRARAALTDAAVWLSLAAALFLAWKVASSLLLIVAGLVFAAGLQGGERLLGKVWRVRRRGPARRRHRRSSSPPSSPSCSLPGPRSPRRPGSSRRRSSRRASGCRRSPRTMASSGRAATPIAALKAQIGNSVGQDPDRARRRGGRRRQPAADRRLWHLRRRRPAPVRTRYRVADPRAAPRRDQGDARRHGGDAQPLGRRAARPHAVRGHADLPRAERSSARHWRFCSGWSRDCSPSSPISARSSPAC